MNETINFSQSLIINEDDPCPWSFLKYSESTMMLCGRHKAIFIDVDILDQHKMVNINTGILGHLQSKIPLVSKHMIPGTNFKFMLECYDSQFIRLRTVQTGGR